MTALGGERYAFAFLANDRYFDWATIFLESVRRRDSTLPLFCIPHGGAMDRIRALRRIFDFEMLEDGIDRLDAFAEQLFPDPTTAPYRGNLRKYAALTLPVEEVAYFDIDTAMLIEPRRLFGHIRPGDTDLIYMSTSPGWVYAPGKLPDAKRLFGDLRLMSAGAFVTSRQVLTIEQLIATIESSRELYQALRHPQVFDQPVFNFAFHQLRKRCFHISERDASIAGMMWVQDKDLRVRKGRGVCLCQAGDVAAVHWAGPNKRCDLQVWRPRTWGILRVRRALHRSAARRLRRG